MRSSSICIAAGLFWLGFGSACGKSSDEPSSAGGAGVATAGSGVAGASAGTPGAGGASAGSSGASAGASSAGASSAGASGASSALLECDPHKVLCKRTAPSCEFGSVPEVVGDCYGECVRVDRCACSTAQQCPDPNQYTCWGQQHCGPFVH